MFTDDGYPYLEHLMDTGWINLATLGVDQLTAIADSVGVSVRADFGSESLASLIGKALSRGATINIQEIKTKQWR